MEPDLDVLTPKIVVDVPRLYVCGQYDNTWQTAVSCLVESTDVILAEYRAQGMNAETAGREERVRCGAKATAGLCSWPVSY